jgi:O-antigen/teichoic acid export membrane protein
MLKNTFAVSKWVTLFTIITAIHARADIYLLEYFASTNRIEDKEVGIFSAAFSLLSVINIVTSGFSEAVLPKISEESSSGYFMEFKNRIKGTISYVVVMAIMVGGILYFVFSYGFNGKYTSSINCMFFIGVGMILTFYIHTLSTMFYPLQRTDLVFKTILLMFCINILGGFLLIPILGSIGAAITNLLVSFSGLVFTVLVLNKLLSKNGDVRIQ